MNKQSVSIFNFNDNNVRVANINGSPWFVAADVFEALGRRGSMSSSLLVLSPDEKGNHVVITPGGPQSVVLISESGLYRIAMRSNSSQARPFQDWVTRDVLPAIRKDGAYIMGEEKVATGEMDEDTLILKAMEALQRKVVRLREENVTLTAANDVMATELNFMTVDEFRSMSHVYLSQGERVP